ncbi:MAG: DUF2911 domain-containing protein [Lutibacter sp.]|nr:DUF2911 domain-containing protein [Lutibacter sp.]MBP9601018.1 DUF2911 domain-containing protein [Lutibacter sp.]
MKTLKITFVLLLIATVTFAQKSPKKQATGKIGEVTATIDYSAPSVKDRVIWGELVKYDQIWRAGANENTTVSFDKDVKITGKTIPAGKYGLFVIPTKGNEWTVVLSKKNDAWGSKDYSESNDLLRFTVNTKATVENKEEMTFDVVNNGIQFNWEKIQFFIEVE